MNNTSNLKDQIYAALKNAGLKAAITGRSPDNKYAVHRRGYVVGFCLEKSGALTVHFEYERWFLHQNKRDFSSLYAKHNETAAQALAKAGFDVETDRHSVIVLPKPEAEQP